jgi:hypothetical protein
VEEGEGAVTPDASDHVLPCRPTISCIADLATPGTLEVEAGYNYARTASYFETRSFPFLLKLTLSKLLQLQAGANGLTVTTSTTFFDDVLLGVKLHLADQGKVAPSIAITALVGVPTSANSYVDVFVTLHASKDIGALHVDANLGLAQLGLDTQQTGSQGFGAVALSMSLPSPFGVALETYLFSDSSQPALASHDGGLRMVVTASPKPWLVFDFGGDVGYFPSVRAFSVFFGMSFVPVVLWR